MARIARDEDQFQIFEDIRQLAIKSAKHVHMHEEELDKARKGIKKSAAQIRLVAFLLLGLGIVLSFREIRIRELRDRNHEKIAAIKVLVSSLDARDPYTKGHSERVANFAVTVGKTMDIPKKILDQLYLAGLMHDIGKIAVSDKVLLKQERLNNPEFQEMKKHPAATAKFISDIEELHDVLLWTLYYHERYDGKGYPEGLKGNDIFRCQPKFWPLPTALML
jgi:HD-GYP domain-containing protein (c-di-GMP phosphodiesterase class II)